MIKKNNTVYYDNAGDDLPSEETELNYGNKQGEVDAVPLEEQEVPMWDTADLPTTVEIVNIQGLPNEDYALLRRNGFGASDSSILCGVNPYKNIEQLIEEKTRTTLSEEEKAVGTKVAVRKGNDLEPLIIQKYEKVFGTRTIKPVDMYVFKEYPYLKCNYDGVTYIDGNWYPVEIKVCTYYGEKHYNPAKALFTEGVGFRPMPEDVSNKNWTIETKAAYYGVPPYYYTQIQMEMAACGAPWGHLTVLHDKSWLFNTYFIWRDVAVQNEVITKGFEVWKRIEAIRASKGLTYEDFMPKEIPSDVEIRKVSTFDYVQDLYSQDY